MCLGWRMYLMWFAMIELGCPMMMLRRFCIAWALGSIVNTCEEYGVSVTCCCPKVTYLERSRRF